MTQMQQDSTGSLGELKFDWDIFSFDNELRTRRDEILQNFNRFRLLSEQIGIDEGGEGQEQSVNKLKVIDSGFENAKKEYGNILIDLKNMGDNGVKEIKDSNEILHSKIQTLQKEIEDLQKDESSASSDYKQEKLSYQKALNLYATHTGLKITIKEKADNIVKGVVKFAGVKHETPILVTANVLDRKIIDISCSEIETKDENVENMQSLANIPGLMCTLREYFVSGKK